MPNLRICA